MTRYFGFASEDDYHADYTLAAMLERATNLAERKAIRADLRAIRERKQSAAQ